MLALGPAATPFDLSGCQAYVLYFPLTITICPALSRLRHYSTLSFSLLARSRYYFPLVCPSIWARRRNKMTISMCSRPTNSYCAVSESRQDLLLFSVPAHHSRNHERTTRAAVLFPRSYTRFSLQPSESVAGKVIARTITLLFRISPVTACTCPELICSAFTANCRAVSALRRKKLYLFTCLLRRLRHLSGKHRWQCCVHAFGASAREPEKQLADTRLNGGLSRDRDNLDGGVGVRGGGGVGVGSSAKSKVFRKRNCSATSSGDIPRKCPSFCCCSDFVRLIVERGVGIDFQLQLPQTERQSAARPPEASF